MILADRFLALPSGDIADLATGAVVTFERRAATDRRAPCADAGPAEEVVDAGWLNAGEEFVAYERCGDQTGVAPRPHLDRPLRAVVELLDSPSDRVRSVAIRGDVAEARAWRREFARAARLRGIVPVAVEALAAWPAAAPALAGRTIAVAGPFDGADDDAARFVTAVVVAASAGSRIALGFPRDDGRGGSVLVVGSAPRESAGRPFATGRMDGHAADGLDMRVRTVAPVATRAGAGCLTPCRLLRRAHHAIASGRRVAAERDLRAALALATRRNAPAGLVASIVQQLAASLLRSGAARDALRTASASPLASMPAEHAVIVAALRVQALIDLACFDRARPLAEALLLAGRHSTPDAHGTAAVALARCAFWQGHYDRARAALDDVPEIARADDGVRVAWWRRRARVLLALGDPSGAAHAVAAIGGPAAGRSNGWRAGAWIEAALTHAALGDEAACLRQLSMAAASARRGAGTLPARIELARVEAIRVSRDRESAAWRRPIRLRPSRAIVPPLYRLRLAAARAVPGTRRHTAASRALARAGCVVSSGRCAVEVQSVADPVIEILSVSQDDDQPHALALERVCEVIRARVGASLVVVANERGEPVVKAGLGVAPFPAAALHALEGGDASEGLARDLELATSVQLGGRTLGALAVRWPIGTRAAGPDARRLIEMCAAAIAARLRALVEERALTTVPDADDLGLAGVSGAMARLREAVVRAAAAPFPVLVEGESGSGKELVARAIHRASARRHRRWCAVNCAALTDDLLEAELFGHARGAFTGAHLERAGLFEEADGGTLFLDEVAELSARAQAKLLRTLQENEVRRLGENFARRVDARVIAATNKPLRAEVAAGRFRDDLRYRLDVVRLWVPPLRERREDIPVLTARVWAEAAGRAGSKAVLTASVVSALARHDWPGNVRELQNVLAALAVCAPPRGRVAPALLTGVLGITAAPRCGVTLDQARREFEAEFVRAALVRAAGRRAEAARELGLTRQGLAKLMARLGIDRSLANTRARVLARPAARLEDRAS